MGKVCSHAGVLCAALTEAREETQFCENIPAEGSWEVGNDETILFSGSALCHAGIEMQAHVLGPILVDIPCLV